MYSSGASRLSAALLVWTLSLGGRRTSERNSAFVPRTVDSVSVSKGDVFACALTSPGRIIYCWGRHDNDGSAVTNSRTPLRVTVPGDERDSIIAVSAGATPFVCALRAAGQAYCWGENEAGELGDGTLVKHRLPSRVRVPRPLVAISAGENAACGLTSDGLVYCWGTNEQGQLGVGDSSVHRLPVRVKSDLRFRQISVGAAGGVCAVTTEHQVACWGRNDGGQLGTADESTLLAPTMTPLAKSSRFDAVSVGNGFVCGITVAAHVSCWGSPSFVLGARAPAMVSVVEVPLPSTERVMALSSGFQSTCVVMQTQHVYCWGSNATGELGRQGAPPSEHSPAPTTSTNAYAAISAGGFVCGITTERALDCWGWDPLQRSGRAPDPARISRLHRINFE
jgi:alpha-tubulin suppressor-like RCC1 family protein